MNNVLEHPKRKSKVLNEIRTILNVYFPGTHFKMNTYNDINYKVIDINYTDGVSLTRVKNAVHSFKRPANPDINFPGIEIKINRNMSVGIKKQLLGELKNIFNLKTVPSEKDWVESLNSTAGNYIAKIFKMRDFD